MLSCHFLSNRRNLVCDDSPEEVVKSDKLDVEVLGVAVGRCGTNKSEELLTEIDGEVGLVVLVVVGEVEVVGPDRNDVVVSAVQDKIEDGDSGKLNVLQVVNSEVCNQEMVLSNN